MIITPQTSTCTECGTAIDVTGCDELAKFITHCDRCAHEANHRLAQQAEAKQAQEHRKQRADRADQIWEKTVKKRYRNTRLDHPDYPVELHHQAMDWLSMQERGGDVSPWIGIIGTSGKGKTRVASQLIKNRIDLGQRVAWINATAFQWNAQKQHDPIYGAACTVRLATFRCAEFLVFDDLGKQHWTKSVESQFYDLVEDRYGDDLPMVWTSNSSLSDLREMLTTDRGDPIIGRLAEMSLILEI